MKFLIKLFPMVLLAGCGATTNLVEVDQHIPARLLSVCPAPADQAQTLRQVLVKMAKVEKQLFCANGKILAIAEIIQK